jgi:hypothetical protein
MKIAVIDGYNQDIGLNILFPSADYFIHSTEVDKSKNMNKYSIIPRTDIQNVNDTNYDILFIIIALYDTKPGTRFFKQNIKQILDKELEIINNNNFKKVFIFDNYDYDYDPNEIIKCDKIDLFFKRNYNKQKIYNENVVPFPFIMFGEVSLIEKTLEKKLNSEIEKMNRIFFTGTLFHHNDEQLNYVRDRRSIYNKIKDVIYNPGILPYNKFLSEIRNSKYSLDLNGVGDPNKRTFEILSQGSLMISEYNDLKWPFEEDDEFNDELKFRDEKEFYKIMDKLNKNPDFYNKCLENQNKIFNKYFNLEWIRDYILQYIYNV